MIYSDQEFDKAQAEYALTSDLAHYAEAIDMESISLMAKEIEGKMHEMFRFANQLQAQAERDEAKKVEYMDKVEDQEFKHGEERE